MESIAAQARGTRSSTTRAGVSRGQGPRDKEGGAGAVGRRPNYPQPEALPHGEAREETK
ncbi:MAG: hypothetical protein AVDCRST_MAG02-477 [uncultured Rubrobacteraceae bacterium]|uniref:Uncharacterized protein n=1 Tax=uncultured Rubrobacteraceae bacterium TaxID=349277 RepID=A0A6J4QPS3_9ACTN|nr:MAG: hypothetical protein AVDCRST_MAG02-477 [uncultured Rubrobacteraceae bacterium]